MSTTIFEAETQEHLAAARDLFREYAASLPFSLCFQGFDSELATLPGRYARPSGCILLASDRGRTIGCAALRPIEAMAGDRAPVCEMKRMYVRPEGRGRGIGRALAERLLSEARGIGYGTMKLDSESDFEAAMSLYASLGFRPTARYNDDPHERTVWMALDLQARVAGGPV